MSSDIFVTCWTAYCKDEWEVTENVCWGCGYASDHSEPHPKYWTFTAITYSTWITMELL